MKVLFNLGRFASGRNALVIQKGDHREYILARGYNPDLPEGEQWGSGSYYYTLPSFVTAMRREEGSGAELNDAIDIVCLNCVEDTLTDNSCCDICPVRKLYDSIDKA